eukprot:1015124-Prymnesium_polylepis.1
MRAGAGCAGAALTTTPAAFLPSPPSSSPICRRSSAVTVAEHEMSCGGALPGLRSRIARSIRASAGRLETSRRSIAPPT